MWTMLKELWTDPTAFRYAVKATIAFAGSLLASGIIPTDKWRLGFLVMAIAQGIPGGQRNKTEP